MTHKEQSKHIASLQVEAEETLRTKTLLQRALYRVAHDYLTLTALAIVALLIVVSFAAPIIVELFLDIEYNIPDLYNSKLPMNATVTDSDSTVWQWVTETGESRRPFIGHTQSVIDLSFHSTEPIFATASDDGEVRVWHIPTGRTQRLFQAAYGSELKYTAVAFGEGGELVATGTSEGSILVFARVKEDSSSVDVPLFTLEVGKDPITNIAYSSDSQLILASNSSEEVSLWNTESGDLLHKLDASSTVNAVAIAPDNSLFAIAREDGLVSVYDTDTAEESFSLEHIGGANAVAFGSDGYIATGGNDSLAKVWTIDGSEHQAIEHDAAVNSVAFTNDGLLLTGVANGSAFLLNPTTGEIVQSFAEFDYPVNEVLMSPDGETIITATAGRERYYFLGTDTSGRDHFSRLLYAGQVSLRIGILAGVGALTIGVVLGVISGYFGGRLDDFIIWIITTLDSIPGLYLLLIVSALLAPNDTSLIMILVFLGWTGSTRIVRGETFSLREREYVLAARAVGASNMRIMFVHIVPNVVSILLIVLTRRIGGLILAESTLSFLGFGVKPPTPTWGNMLSADLDVLRDAPHLVFAPGLLISVTVLCLYVIGDGLRDAFDPNVSD